MTTEPLILEEQLQHERMARAQAALQRGEMQVLPLEGVPDEYAVWVVASKGSRYTVTLEGDAWACTCPDFSGRCQRFGLRCKHIEAVRLSEPASAAEPGPKNPNTQPKFSVNHMEERMNQSTSTHDPPALDLARQGNSGNPSEQGSLPGDQIIWRLRQPLDMSRVKRRQAPGQGTVPYLEGFDVIEVANDLFLFRWSFDLLSEPRIMRWDKVVTFYDQRVKKKVPVLGEDGKPTTEIAGVAYITGRITVELDGKAYSHADVGRCILNGDTPEALDMAIAGAATDCLKRCFRHLGEQFGNSLYDKEVARTAGLENGSSNGSMSNRNSSTGQQAGQAPKQSQSLPPNPSASQPEALQYRDGAAVDMSNAAEVEAFNAFKSAHQNLAPASREVLRAWVSVRNGK